MDDKGKISSGEDGLGGMGCCGIGGGVICGAMGGCVGCDGVKGEVIVGRSGKGRRVMCHGMGCWGMPCCGTGGSMAGLAVGDGIDAHMDAGGQRGWTGQTAHITVPISCMGSCWLACCWAFIAAKWRSSTACSLRKLYSSTFSWLSLLCSAWLSSSSFCFLKIALDLIIHPVCHLLFTGMSPKNGPHS